MPAHRDLTTLLVSWSNGDKGALDEMTPLLYEELRGLARYFLSVERSSHTLQPTALVHEAYLRLIDQHSVDWRNRAHFLGVAATMMRRILINYAEARRSAKREGQANAISLDEALEYLNRDFARSARSRPGARTPGGTRSAAGPGGRTPLLRRPHHRGNRRGARRSRRPRSSGNGAPHGSGCCNRWRGGPGHDGARLGRDQSRPCRRSRCRPLRAARLARPAVRRRYRITPCRGIAAHARNTRRRVARVRGRCPAQLCVRHPSCRPRPSGPTASCAKSATAAWGSSTWASAPTASITSRSPSRSSPAAGAIWNGASNGSGRFWRS